jgi:hypothetical protein
MRRSFALLAVVVVVVVVATATATATAATTATPPLWSQRYGTSQRDSRSALDGPHVAANMTQLWRWRLGTTLNIVAPSGVAIAADGALFVNVAPDALAAAAPTNVSHFEWQHSFGASFRNMGANPTLGEQAIRI